MTHKVSLQLQDKTLTIETGKLAKQANGSVLISCGETRLLVPVTMSKKSDLNNDFFPLQVHYQEKYYAAGKIPGGFIKREGKPKDKEILISRLTDRPIRPLFPAGFRNEVQILPTTLSADQINPQDILSIIGSSAALSISDIPFNGPLGAVRIGLIDKKYVINPNFEQIMQSPFDLIIAGTKKGILIIEGTAKELSEKQMVEAVEEANQYIQKIIELQENLVDICGKTKQDVEFFTIEEKTKNIITQFAEEKVQQALQSNNKLKMHAELDKIQKEALDNFLDPEIENHKLQIKSALTEIEHQVLQKMILEQNQRIDKRKMDEIRPISCEINLLPRTHGSALFTRGETQSLAVVTLGASKEGQRFDDLEIETEKNFFLHYNFPHFSVGETGRVSNPGRREIGHGALAEKAIIPIIPNQDDFPYTIRVVSEILESNGSSSMASVCSAALSLLAAGVPVNASVSGVAMGLVKKGDQYKILTDIQGAEDHLGDMDFKVAGTKKGITSFQLDMKIEGIPMEIISKTLEQSTVARLKILEIMNQTIAKPKDSISEYAPKIIRFDIDPNKVKDIIGAGGKTIRRISEMTDSNIDIDNNGRIVITAKTIPATIEAKKAIDDIVADAEVGKIYTGKVKRITDFGAFIEILPGKEGLCHISQLSNQRIKKVQDFLKENDTVIVKCTGIDDMGRIKLSIKQAK